MLPSDTSSSNKELWELKLKLCYPTTPKESLDLLTMFPIPLLSEILKITTKKKKSETPKNLNNNNLNNPNNDYCYDDFSFNLYLLMSKLDNNLFVYFSSLIIFNFN